MPSLTIYLAAYGFLLNLGLFLFFIDGMGKALRPSSALRVVALAGREVVRTVYPHQLDEQHSATPWPIKSPEGEPERIILNTADGAVLSL